MLRALDRLDNGIQRCLIRWQVRRKATFIPDRGVEAFALQHTLQGVENLRTITQCFRKIGRTDRQDHEFLDIDAVIGMHTTVDDVHHRYRHGGAVSEMPEKRLALRQRLRLRRSQRHRKQGVRTEIALVGTTVQLDHLLIERTLIRKRFSEQRSTQYAVHIRNGLSHTLAEIARMVAVPELDGFAGSRRCAGGHSGAGKAAICERYLGLNGGIAAGVQDFPGVDVDNLDHFSSINNFTRWGNPPTIAKLKCEWPVRIDL